MSTREGFPELWGLQEIVDYGERIAEEYGDPARPDGRHVSVQRAQDWTRRAAFPQPVAQLAMGAVYLAEEVAPKVEEIMANARATASPHRGGLPPQLRAAILSAKDTGESQLSVARRLEVNPSTVRRLWTGRR